MELEILPRDAAPEASQPSSTGSPPTSASSPTSRRGRREPDAPRRVRRTNRRGRHVVRPRAPRDRRPRRRVAVDNAYGVAFHSTVLGRLGVDDGDIEAMRSGDERVTPCWPPCMRSPGRSSSTGARSTRASSSGPTRRPDRRRTCSSSSPSAPSPASWARRQSRWSRRARRVPAAPGVELTGSPARAQRCDPCGSISCSTAWPCRRPKTPIVPSPSKASRTSRRSRSTRSVNWVCRSLGSSTPARHEPARPRRSGTVRCTAVSQRRMASLRTTIP